MTASHDNDLTRKLAALNREPGPLVIVARPHSGTRLLAEIFGRAGVFMGDGVHPHFLDSEPWYRRFVFPLIVSSWFPDWDRHWGDERFRSFCQHRLDETLRDYVLSGVPSGPWGWKLSETLFVMPLLRRYFPRARFVHVIRDGRDVVLSDDGYFQLTLRARSKWPRHELALWLERLGILRDPYGLFCARVAFGSLKDWDWDGLDLRRGDIVRRNRFQIQMQSWIHCILTAREYGRTMPDSYVEVRYERLCEEPVATTRELFTELKLTMTPDVEEFLETAVRPGWREKWRRREFRGSEAEDFEKAVRLGAPLLEELE